MGAVSLTDAVFGGVLLVSLLMGAWRGLVGELMSLGGWVAAFLLARWLAADLARWAPFWSEAAEQLRHALAFVVVFVAGMLTAGVLSWLLGRLIETSGLRPVDRSLGAAFGLVRGVVVLLVLTTLVHLLGWRGQHWWAEARLAPWLELLLAGLKPVLPQAFQVYLP